MRTLWKVLNLFVCLLTSRLNAEVSVLYVETGKNLSLNPNIQGTPEEDILWTFNGDKAAEHDLDSLQEYGQFTGRSHIDITTGQITVRDVSSRDSGIYRSQIQISGKLSYSENEVGVIDAVQEPTVTCELNEDSPSKTLNCSVSSQSKVSYEWTGPDSLRRPGQKLEVSVEESSDSVYTCTVRNEVSQKSTSFSLENCSTGSTGEQISGKDILLPAIYGLTGIVVLTGIISAVICFIQRRQSNAKRRSADLTEGESQPLTEMLTITNFPEKTQNKTKEEKAPGKSNETEEEDGNEDEESVDNSKESLDKNDNKSQDGTEESNRNENPSVDKNEEAEKMNGDANQALGCDADENGEQDKNEDVENAAETVNDDGGEPDSQSNGDDGQDGDDD